MEGIGGVPIHSRPWLPTGPLLTPLVGSLTDRKDFHHQARTSAERAASNAVGPAFRQTSDFEGTVA